MTSLDEREVPGNGFPPGSNQAEHICATCWSEKELREFLTCQNKNLTVTQSKRHLSNSFKVYLRFSFSNYFALF